MVGGKSQEQGALCSYQLLEVLPVVAAIGEVDEEVSALVLLLTGVGEVGQNAAISVVIGIIFCGFHKKDTRYTLYPAIR